MGKKLGTRMPIEQRAKQFAPFQAVGGLDEALKKAEEEHRRELESVHTLIEISDNGEIEERC